MGACLLHALDDNFLDLPLERRDWATADQPAVLRRLLAEADGFLVSTPMLAERLAWTGRPIMVVPNALDERLLDATLVGADMPLSRERDPMPQPPARDPRRIRRRRDRSQPHPQRAAPADHRLHGHLHP